MAADELLTVVASATLLPRRTGCLRTVHGGKHPTRLRRNGGGVGSGDAEAAVCDEMDSMIPAQVASPLTYQRWWRPPP